MAEALPQGWNVGLRRERDRRGWTRVELAAKIGTGASSVYRWEEKGDKPNAKMLAALIALFKKPVEAWGTVIWQVPYLRNAYFTGRERTLTRLHTFLSGTTLREEERLPVAVSQARAISGLGGIGKTQTAVEYAHRFGHEYDLVVLVHASSREVLVAELAGLAPLLDLPTYAETDQNRLAQAVKRWLETQQKLVWLLIFDNVDDILLVKEFLPEKGDGAVLLTTRLQGVGKYIHKIELGTLTLEEGTRFFQRRLGEGEEPDQKVLSASEREAAEELYTLLGGLPLALEQAAAYMEEEACSLADYVVLYQQQRAALLDRRSRVDQQDYPDSVATTWLLSFRRVEQDYPDAVDLLRLLAFLHPDAIPEEALQAVVEDPQRLQDAIKHLQEYSLVQQNQTTRTLTIHRLVQAVIQDGLKETDRRFLRERAVLAVNAAFPRPEQETWEQCERLLPHALLAAEYIEQEAITSKEAGRLLQETAFYLHKRARFAEAEPLFERALQIRKQVLGPEHPDVADLLNDLGDLYRERGKQVEAEPLFQRALAINERLLGPVNIPVAMSLNNLANLYRDQSRYGEAEPLYLRARAIFEHLWMTDQPQAAPAFKKVVIQHAKGLSNLGATYLEQGRYAEAEPLLRSAIESLEQRLGPHQLEAAFPLSNLAIVYKDQGRFAEAERHYQRALDIWEQQLGPEHYQVALAVNNFGEFYKDLGRYAEAQPLYERALHIWGQQLGARHFLVAAVLTNLADNARAQGKDAEAEMFFQRALDIWEQAAGPQHYRAYALHGLANLYREQKRYDEAEPLYQQALEIRKKVWQPPHYELAESLHDLAQLRQAQGDSDQARAWYVQALEQREQTLGAQHPKTVETRQSLIALLRAMGQHDEARRLEAAQAEPETSGAEREQAAGDD